MSATVESILSMRLLGHPADRGTDVSATFRYEVRKPFAVETAFHLASTDVVWTYARDLLLSGLIEHTGQGDVRVWPVIPDPSSGLSPLLRMELSSPSGHALLETAASDINAFLTKTLALCPSGQESTHLNIDAWLESLLRT